MGGLVLQVWFGQWLNPSKKKSIYMGNSRRDIPYIDNLCTTYLIRINDSTLKYIYIYTLYKAYSYKTRSFNFCKKKNIYIYINHATGWLVGGWAALHINRCKVAAADCSTTCVPCARDNAVDHL